MSFAEKVTAADPDGTATEAAWRVLANCRTADEARELLGMLALDQVTWQWDIPRCARLVLAKSRHGRVINANLLRDVLPDRAASLVAGTVKALALVGLIEPNGMVVKSTAAGARASLIRCYVLTPAGEDLAADITLPQDTTYLVAPQHG